MILLTRLFFCPENYSQKSRKICDDIFLTQALDIFHKWNYNIINKWNMEAAMLKHGILGLLNYCSMTGYEINRTFKDSLSYFWNAQTSQIYRELQTLKKNGWAEDQTIEQNGKPDKKLFSITESGKAELNRWLVEDSTEFAGRSSLLMKTFFRGERSIVENIEYFDKLADAGANFLKALQTEPPDVDAYASRVNDPQKALYWKMTVEYGVMYAQMHLRWAENCKRELEELANEHSVD